MKKFFTLVLALFAMAFCAKAQITDDFESYAAFTVDPAGTWTYYDGDGLPTYGFNGITFTNAYYTGSCIVFNPTQTSPDCSENYAAHSGSQFLMIFNGVPNDTIGVRVTNDWIISPALSFTSTGILDFYAREITDSYGDEVMKIWYSTTTNTPSAFTLLSTEDVSATTWTNYHYTIPAGAVYVAISCNSEDVFGLMLDDITIMETPSDPTIVAANSSVNFGTVLVGQPAIQQVAVSSYSLTADITATTAAPFTVSADGTTFGTTATLAPAGGTLYIKYIPSMAGAENGSVVLSSTGATDVTITLTGNGLDCNSNPIPYSCDFTSSAQNECWTVVDANDDASTFTIYTSGYAQYHWNSTNPGDDYLISPSFTFTGTQSVTFDYKSGSSYDEAYEVFAFGADTIRLSEPDTFRNSTYTTKTLNVSNLNGAYSIAIHCISPADQFYFYVTNFNVIDASSAIVNVSESDIDFGTIMAGATVDETFTISTTNLNETITINANAPFVVSLDNTTFANSVVIPADTEFITNTTVYVRFAPVAAGTFEDTLTIATNGTEYTVILTGEAVQCNPISEFPYTQDFAEDNEDLLCWEIVDANNDGYTFEYDDGEVYYSYSEDDNANDYLISPEIAVAANLYGHIDYSVASSAYPEKFSIYLIPEDGTIQTATQLVATRTVTNEDYASQLFDLSAYANQTVRIAIKAESDADRYELHFTNFVIEALPETASLTVDPTSMDFIIEVGRTSHEQAATVTGLVLTDDIAVTTAAPFEVSLDGTTYGTTATIAHGNALTATLYVRFAPTTPGNQTGTVTLTSGSTTATINLTGEGIDCSEGISALPFNHDFNDSIIPPYCWSYGNDANFLLLNMDDSGADKGIAIGAPDYLMTPEIKVENTPMRFSFEYATYGGANSSSTFRVGYSTTDNINNFTWLTPVTVTESYEVFETYSTNIPAGTKYVAIEATEIGSFVYFIWQYPNYVLLDNIKISEGEGVEDITSDNVSLYPNPANNVLNVTANSNINTIEVFNMMGQRVAVIDANDTNVQINTTGLSNGMYMMRINTENGVSNQKFTVAR